MAFIPGPGSPGSSSSRTNLAIAAGASCFYAIATETNLPNGFFGSARIDVGTPAGQVAVVANRFSGANQPKTFGGFITRYTPGQDWFNYHAVPLFISRRTGGTGPDTQPWTGLDDLVKRLSAGSSEMP